MFAENPCVANDDDDNDDDDDDDDEANNELFLRFVDQRKALNVMSSRHHC